MCVFMATELRFIMGMSENENKGEIQRWRKMPIKEFISKFHRILLRYKKPRRMERAEHVAVTQNYARKPKADLVVGGRMLQKCAWFQHNMYM